MKKATLLICAVLSILGLITADIYAESTFKDMLNLPTQVSKEIPSNYTMQPATPSPERSLESVEASVYTEIPSNTGQPVVTNTPGPEPVYSIKGFISPDFEYEEWAAPVLKQGFIVDIVGTDYYAVTDNQGYFEINGVPPNLAGYSIKILKPGYLAREIKNVVVHKELILSIKEKPIMMWGGDIAEDFALNMWDVVKLCQAFNTTAGDGKFVKEYDLNRDNTVNMLDVMIIARHFNSIYQNYPEMTLLSLPFTQQNRARNDLCYS